MQKLGHLVREILNADGASKREFAAAIGVTPSHLSRVIHRDERLPIVACLRLAKIAMGRRSATEILVASGHEEVAGLIEQLYGAARLGAPVSAEADVTPAELRYLQRLRELTKPDRRAVDIIVTSLHARPRAASRKRPLPRGSGG
jgi:transcriptional regulator with XRE-family HTH domain